MKSNSIKGTAYDALVHTGRCLAVDDIWRDMLAENIYWASMEGFLQSSFLGAFNRLSQEFLADRERVVAPIPNVIKPDLLIMERSRSVHDEWWNARYVRGASAQQTYLRHTRLIVQFKVAWTPGNASASATLPSKIDAVKGDVEQLQQCGLSSSAAIGVLMSGFHARGDGARVVRESLERVKQSLDNSVEFDTEVVLLEDYRPTRWNTLLDADRAAFSTLWLAQIR